MGMNCSGLRHGVALGALMLAATPALAQQQSNPAPPAATDHVQLDQITVQGERQAAPLLQGPTTITQTRDVATTPCDATLQEGLAGAIRSLGGEPLRLASGAGHDGTAMAKLCPIAMMFVRCRGGISHNPAEYASPADMGLAVAALIRFIETAKL